MVTPDSDVVEFVGRQIKTLERDGVQLMSFGYVNEGSAVMRGPMITQLLDQFLSLTYWGPLDYLVLDMPPGTGDIQLTLSQKLNITAAVIVTTPQELSFVDVERGIEMFDSVNVPCVSVVENMAFLEMGDDDDDHVKDLFDEQKMKTEFIKALQDSGMEATDDVAMNLMDVVRASLKESKQEKKKNGEKFRIFGQGHRERLSNQWGIEHTFSIPLMDKIARNGDSGTPFVIDYPDSEQAAVYNDLAGTVAREIVKVQYAQENSRPTVAYNAENHQLEISFGEDQISHILPPAELRRDCKCAACVEELSGRQILNPDDVPDSIRPRSMGPTGNYALSVDWEGGHKSLYPYRQIRSLIESLEEKKTAPKASSKMDKVRI